MSGVKKCPDFSILIKLESVESGHAFRNLNMPPLCTQSLYTECPKRNGHKFRGLLRMLLWIKTVNKLMFDIQRFQVIDQLIYLAKFTNAVSIKIVIQNDFLIPVYTRFTRHHETPNIS